MGVLGLWQILESVGHPIKVEGLEGKRLGVDANVWLYKFIRGFREKETGTSLESHKLGLFNRVCKLLFYKIKPVFVFDGPAPTLKRRTLERRQNIRYKNLSKVQDAAMRALAEQLKKDYPNKNIDDIRINLPEFRSNGLVAAEKLTDEDRDLFYLPPEDPKQEHDSDDDLDLDVKFENWQSVQTNRIDIESKDFESMPPEIRYEILHEVKSKTKRITNPEALPDDPNSFSNLQLQRLNARRNIQAKIEKCERDICSEVSPLVIQYEGQRNPEFDIQRRDPFNDDIKPPSDVASASSSSTFRPVHRSEFIDPPQEPKPKSEPIIDFELDSDSETSSTSSMVECPPVLSPTSSESTSNGQMPSQHSDSSLTELASQSTCNQSQSNKKDLTANMNDTIQLDASALSDTEETSAERSFLSPSPKKVSTTICISDSSEDSDIEEIPPKKISAIKRQSPLTSPLSSQPKRPSLEPAPELIEEEPAPVAESRSDAYPRASDILPPEGVQSPVKLLAPEVLVTSSLSTSESAPNELIAQPTPVTELDTTKDTLEEVAIGPSRPPQIEPPESVPPVTSATTTTTQTTTTTTTASTSTGPTWSQPTSYSQASQSQGSGVSHTTAAATRKVTTKVIEEAKELLTLFGVPYIDAAGEAEAQCALLEELGLTEGTITDDSDVWLFGAQNVYRHFFSNDNYVLQYKLKDIEFHVRLTRENMVCFAMLVGSDYTDGIRNVGSVTALEILSEFPGDDLEPLIKFKRWRDDPSSKQKPGNRKRKGLLKYNLPDEFPSRAVFEGYMKPTADSSTEKFTWGKANLDELRDYARRNFGWDSKKIDDKLLPVMKKQNERETQRTIDTFFFKTQANQNPELFRSKRINEALKKIAERDDELVCLSEEDDDDRREGRHDNEKEEDDDDGNLWADQRQPKPSASKKKATGRGAKGGNKNKPAETAKKATSSRGRRRKM